ncbi:MAG: putative bifunctional diguanylate cyclase/phosphodiesterase [Thiobacillus sp.]
MKRRFHAPGMGLPIALGFVLVLWLMVALGAIGLRHVSEANRRLRDIAQNNNVKTELATAMHNALRERALSMHALSIMTDPFDRDAEIQRFNAQGNRYVEARARLASLATSAAERRILGHILELTRQAQPEVQAVVEMSVFMDDQAAIFERIRNVAMPRQRAIAEEVNNLVDLQRQQTNQAVLDAEESYLRVRTLMLSLGALALAAGILIAWIVGRHVTRQARQLADQAMYDPLTGLANRTLLQRQLEYEIELAKRSSTSFAVALLDLDRFKEVNDTLGHTVGDELLREAGSRLQQAVRAVDTVGRLGGDEYVVLLHDITPGEVDAIARKLLDVLDRPFHWKNQGIDLSASMGIAFYPEQCDDAGSLLRCADIAMYVAKNSGKGFALYAPEHDHSNRNDLSLKSELREALQSGQLTLHYQPQIDHRSQCVVGLEALVRWNHPQRGFLGPDSFVPLAEDAGLIGPLTHWVLRSALRAQLLLQRSGFPLGMAVNLSARNLQDMNLANSVQALLDEIGVEAKNLTLEITESAVMDNPSDALTILSELDRMGVTIAIDDFGTGYSSLAYLKRLPVDKLKIDKSFVLDMEINDNDAVIVRSIIDLAHNLGLQVIAEGVENRDTWDTLEVLGCDTSQGYLMGRPMPVEALIVWLREATYSKILKRTLAAV